jgi:hypothetical protein
MSITFLSYINIYVIFLFLYVILLRHLQKNKEWSYFLITFNYFYVILILVYRRRFQVIKYLNYISYFLIIVYIVYVLNVYICIKFNYLHTLRIKILNHYINKYKIISNEKDDLIYVIKNHYLIMFILSSLFCISLLSSSTGQSKIIYN